MFPARPLRAWPEPQFSVLSVIGCPPFRDAVPESRNHSCTIRLERTYQLLESKRQGILAAWRLLKYRKPLVSLITHLDKMQCNDLHTKSGNRPLELRFPVRRLPIRSLCTGLCKHMIYDLYMI